MRKRSIINIILTIALCVNTNKAIASKLEVEADGSLEWHRDKQLYVARENAKATQDNKSILADILYAHYKETDKSDMDIWKIEAEENVLIQDGETKILGDKATYIIETQELIITGDNMNAISNGYQIKANKEIRYIDSKNQIEALGNVVLYSEKEEIHCDKLIAKLAENEDGEREISELFVYDNVEIITGTDKITGNSGYYNIKEESAEVKGDVIISREDSVITGDKAEINTNTGTAKMLSNNSKVKAIFISKDK